MFGTGVCPKHEVISEAGGALTNTVKEVLCDILFPEPCLFVSTVSGKLCKRKKERMKSLENTGNFCTVWDLGCTA